MAKKVLSIEIGNFLTRVMEVDYQAKNPKVYRCISFATPDAMISDGAVAVSQEFATMLKKCLYDHKIKTRQVVFNITSSKIASREVNIPKVKENRIKTLVETNASDYFPITITDYELGYSILGEEYDNGQLYKLLVYAAPKKMLESYMELAAICGLTVVGFDHGGNSLYQVVKEECGNGVQLVIKVDENTSFISVFVNGKMALQRSVAQGIDELIQDCMENDQVSYTEALHILRTNDYIGEMVPGTPMEDNVKSLLQGILRVVDYFKTKSQNSNIDRVCLTGLGADVVGLAERIADALEMDVDILNNVAGFSVDKYFKGVSFGEYIGCLGAVLAPVGFGRDINGDNVKAGAFGNYGVALFFGGILISVALLVVCTVSRVTANAESDRLKLYLSSLRYMEDVYNKYADEKVEDDYVKAIQHVTLNRNNNIVAFIEEMEKKMPANARVVSMICDESSVILSMETTSKTEAAYVVTALSEFSSLAQVYVGSITESESEEGMKTVTFTVECTYYPYGFEEDTEEGTAEGEVE